MARPRYGVGLDTSDHTTVALCKVDQCTWRAMRFDRTDAFTLWQHHTEDQHPEITETVRNRMPVNMNYGRGRSKKVPACG